MVKLKMVVLCRLLRIQLIDSSPFDCLFCTEMVCTGLIRVAGTSVLSNLLLHRVNLRRKISHLLLCLLPFHAALNLLLSFVSFGQFEH